MRQDQGAQRLFLIFKWNFVLKKTFNNNLILKLLSLKTKKPEFTEFSFQLAVMK